jgi:hypothetical protein
MENSRIVGKDLFIKQPKEEDIGVIRGIWEDPETMKDDVWINNTNGYKMLIKYGFREISRNSDAILLELSKHDFYKER